MDIKALLFVGLLLLAGFSVFEYRELGEERRRVQSLSTDLEQSTANVARLQEQNKQLTADLEAARKNLDELKNLSKRGSSDLQALEQQLAEQRARVEQKQRDYQKLIAEVSPNDPNLAAKIKNLNDEIASIEQRLKSSQQAAAYEKDVAQSARSSQGASAAYELSQNESRIHDAQAAIADLKSRRAGVPHGRLHPEGAAQIADYNQQIQVANNQLKDLLAQRSALKVRSQQDRKQLDANAASSVGTLSHEQAQLRQKLEADRNELKRIAEVRGVSGQFTKERNELVRKLASELQDETTKLKELENTVREQKARLQPAAPN